jgi:hypothetical protein
MKKISNFFIGLAALLIIFAMPAFSSAAVTYFTDCAWEGTELTCHVYVDTGGDSLISGGVKLSYDTSKLSDPSAEKNEGVWFFGTEGGTTYAYMDPEVDTSAGTITYIVGKLDEEAPTAGVSGDRVIIGTVAFTRSASDDPCSGGNPVGFYGIDLMLGRDGDYENFVSTTGVALDGSATKGAIKAAERGDANANCEINTTDYVAVRNLIGTENPPPYADCNGNGEVNTTDYVCIRNKI